MALKLGDLAKVPPKQKIFLVLLTSILVAVGYYYLYYKAAAQEIAALESRLAELSSKIKEQQVIARNLPSFQAEVRRLEEQLGLLLDQLPDSAEIPSLLRNVSDLGKESGLEFVKFSPKSEVKRNFYGEIPVSIHVTGSYHSFLLFADKVSRLPRIVNLSDMVFSQPRVGAEDRVAVSIACTATTFRFLEQASQNVADKGKSK